MSISNMIHSQMSNQPNSTYVNDIYDDDQDYDDDLYSYTPKKKTKSFFCYKSIVICIILASFILFLFSSKCYTMLDSVTADRVELFNSEGEPKYILIGLQLLVIFIILKIISKY